MTWRLLAIDPGKVSGWAIFENGRYIASGEAETAWVRSSVVQRAAADIEVERFVVGAERWTAGGRMGLQAAIGLGAQWGVWLEHLNLAQVRKAAVLRVPPQTWCGQVLRTSKAKRVEHQRVFFQRAGITPSGQNEADAICIGWYFLKTGKAFEALPKKVQKDERTDNGESSEAVAGSAAAFFNH